MALIGGAKYARDLAAAKRTFTEWIAYYTPLVIPGHKIKVKYEIIHESYDAWAEVYDDGTIELIINTIFLEANMYNLMSEEIMMLPIHELCHAKIFYEDLSAWLNRVDPNDKEVLHDHRDSRFVNCVKQFIHKKYARTGPHPGKLSFKHYFGSKSGIVPVDIFYIYNYRCPTCNATWDENSLMRYGKLQEPENCGECGGPIENVKHLTPREVVRFDVPDDIIVYR